MRLRLLQPHDRRPFAANHLDGGLPAMLPAVVAVLFAVEPDVERDYADFGLSAAAQGDAQTNTAPCKFPIHR